MKARQKLRREAAGITIEKSVLVACWIDLLVPFCGDYTEAAAWTEAETKKYEHFLKKRRDMEAVEERNIAELIGGRK